MIGQKIKFILSNPHKWHRWIRDFFLDIRHGYRFLGGPISNADFSRGWCSSTSTDYNALNIMFSEIHIRECDVLVDVGCGKGRVFNWILNRGLKNKLIGIEVRPDIAKFTRKRLCEYQQVKILTKDIIDGIFPTDGTIFYLFDPFSEWIVKSFSNQITESIKQGYFSDKDRPLIIYYNCCHLNVFEENPIWNVKRLGNITSMNLPAAIIEPKVIQINKGDIHVSK